MGDGTKESPYTRKDVLKAIEENGGTAKGLDLSGKYFEKGIDLSKLVFEGIILRDAVLSYANFEDSRLWEADLQGTRLDFANFKAAELYFARLSGAVLWFAEFARDTKLESIDWGKYILGEENNGNFTAAQITYRRLKMWHTSAGMYDIASEFYYREMEVKRKDFKSFFKPWHFNCLKLGLSRLLFGYGERWERLIFWIAGFILVFAFIYFAIGTLTPSNFLNSLYYSAVSFVSLGYGSWVQEATGWVKGLGVFETFLGFFMMTLLLVTFVRNGHVKRSLYHYFTYYLAPHQALLAVLISPLHNVYNKSP